MAVSIAPPVPGITAGLRLILDADCDATAEPNALGHRGGTVFLVSVDNPNGGAVFVKIYDAKTATIGTTDPDLTFKVAATSKKTFFCPSGVELETGLTFGCVTDGGGTAGTTNPASNVPVSIMAQDS